MSGTQPGEAGTTYEPDTAYEDGSRVEAAEAGLHHEAAEAHAGQVPAEHVTAVDVVDAPAEHHQHHPGDPNDGVVRGRTSTAALLVGALAAALTIAAVVLLALQVGTS